MHNISVTVAHILFFGNVSHGKKSLEELEEVVAYVPETRLVKFGGDKVKSWIERWSVGFVGVGR